MVRLFLPLLGRLCCGHNTRPQTRHSSPHTLTTCGSEMGLAGLNSRCGHGQAPSEAAGESPPLPLPVLEAPASLAPGPSPQGGRSLPPACCREHTFLEMTAGETEARETPEADLCGRLQADGPRISIAAWRPRRGRGLSQERICPSWQENGVWEPDTTPLGTQTHLP